MIGAPATLLKPDSRAAGCERTGKVGVVLDPSRAARPQHLAPTIDGPSSGQRDPGWNTSGRSRQAAMTVITAVARRSDRPPTFGRCST